MSNRVYVTGMGIISALGTGVDENFAALKAGNTGIAFPQYLTTIHKNEIVTGEVKMSNEALASKAGTGKKQSSRTALLGLIAAKEALASAGLTKDILISAGFINGTSVGGMDISEKNYADFSTDKLKDYKQAFGGHDCGASTEFIWSHLGLSGPLSTISTACSSSANSIMHATRLIKAERAHCIIAGGTDALSLFTLNGFNALKILDPNQCKPFDKNREGLNLGEGAAYLVLESEENVLRRKGKVLGEIIGYGNTNDAYHQTASSPEGKGAFLAMKKAIASTGKEDLAVDYINAHGTGTINNDSSESAALHHLFKKDLPDYSSTKSFTGHTLGAAGAIEAVFSVLAIQYDVKFANLNLEDPMEAEKRPLDHYIEKANVNCVLSNSFGFGGNCTSLIFSKSTLRS